MLRVLIASSFVAGCALAGEPQPHVAAPDAPAPTAIDATEQIDPPPSVCDQLLATLGTDFESGASGWTHAVLDGASAPGWPLDEWQVGTATSGPGSCHGGTTCWATRLDANYTSCQRAAVTSPAMDLSMCSGETVKLAFWSWHDFWTGTVPNKSGTWSDGGIVEVSGDGTTWLQVTPSPAYPGTVVINPNIGTGYQCVSANNFHVNNQPGFVGAGGSWQQVTVALPAAAVTPAFRVRFAYSSGVSFQSTDPEVDRQHTRPGWYLDDVSFSR